MDVTVGEDAGTSRLLSGGRAGWIELLVLALVLACVFAVERRAVAHAPDDAALVAATASASPPGPSNPLVGARAAYAVACRARHRGVAGEPLLEAMRGAAGVEARALLRAWRPQLLAPPGGR
jgi:hypothetical protein